MSGGERLGLLHRSLGQDGVDALRVRQLQVSPPGRQVVILLPPAVPRMSRMSTIKSPPGPCSEECHLPDFLVCS